VLLVQEDVFCDVVTHGLLLAKIGPRPPAVRVAGN
jgi:hypothetical protein